MKIEPLKRFIANLEKLGYDADLAVRRLSEVDDLEADTKRALTGRDDAVREQRKEQQELTRIHGATNNASATLGYVNDQIVAARNLHEEISTEVQTNSHLIMFARAVCSLFSDLSKIPPILLLELEAMISQAYEAGMTPGPLPFDYGQTRQKAIDVLEHALGKKLVLREHFDELMHSSVQKHDDMMLDKLGKMETERAKLTAEKSELAKFNETVDQATSEKLLTVALKLEGKGFIQVHKCRSCGRILSATPAGAKCTIHNCPFCGYH